jgi:hypothetical protein
VVGFPEDSLNPDPAGPWGGDPDADDPPETPTAYCTPYLTNISFNGSAGGAPYVTCTEQGEALGWSLIDPDAVNFSKDDGPRSNTSPCSLDVDGDDLTDKEEAYFGTDPLDADTDNDGYADGADNCKLISNADQADLDGDGQGDACDTDVDGDGVDNDSDNCLREPNGGQENGDADQWGDACDNCPSVATPWLVPADDGDCDGFTDGEETFLGTDAVDACPDTVDDDAWPADLASGLPSPDDGYGKYDGTVNILDIVWLAPPVFGASPPDPNYTERKDFNGDGTINILDIVRLTPPMFGQSCTP